MIVKVLRQIAWVHALRLEIRGQSEESALARYVPPAEWGRVAAADARPLVLQTLQSEGILAAYRTGVLSGLDNFQLEQALAGLSQQHALAQRLLEEADRPSAPRPVDGYLW